MYRFELVTKSGRVFGWKASHAFELPAVFERPNHPFSQFQFKGETQEVFERICQDIHGDWVRLITTGEPNLDWQRF